MGRDRRVSITLDQEEYDLLVRVSEAENRTMARQVAHYIRVRVWADARRLWPTEYRNEGPAHAQATMPPADSPRPGATRKDR